MEQESIMKKRWSKKRGSKEMGIDRLSALPDSLLIEIVSNLESKEAVKTCALSKRWQFLWPESTRINFECCSPQIQKLRDFVARVHKTLVICGRNNFHDFKVSFHYKNCFASDVNAWIHFTVKSKVKMVTLLLYPDIIEDCHSLPEIMYSNSSLKELCVLGCNMVPREAIEWPSLTRLSIQSSCLFQDTIEKILLGCPVLRNLVLLNCWGFDRLEINSPSLCHLEIEDSISGTLSEISAPFVQSLNVKLYPIGPECRLTNISADARCIIDIPACRWAASSVEVMSYVKELSGYVHHVKELELGPEFIKVLSKLEANDWKFPQSRVVSLKVRTYCNEYSIYGFIGLLESSPNLETLVLEGGFIGLLESSLNLVIDEEDEEEEEGPERVYSNCRLPHLKAVIIKSFADKRHSEESMLKLAQFLLKRAVILEKMIITFPNTACASTLASTLLSYPKSSSKAVILLR